MTSPAYLRDLALKFAATKRPRDLVIAERLRDIAAELDVMAARLETRATNSDAAIRPPRDLTRGIDAKLAEMRRVPAPTPAELAAIRGLIGGKS